MVQEIGPGDFVKVLREGQRMWWQIIEIKGRKITAMLDSEPATHIDWNEDGTPVPLPIQPTLKRNDVITFDASEIMDWCGLPKPPA